MELQNFHYAQFLTNSLYGLDLQTEDFEEIGLVAWNLIGNKNVKLYRFCTTLDESLTVDLPCNAIEVEAVTYGFEDWEHTTNYSDNGEPVSHFVENAIEREKAFKSPFYMSGKMAKYEQIGNTLYFSHNYGPIKILYKGIFMDDEGLPEITDKEAAAIACYVAYTQKFKEGIITNNAQVIQVANLLKAEWNRLCDQARIQRLNQNDMNNILEVKGSWDRAAYGKSYKPLR